MKLVRSFVIPALSSALFLFSLVSIYKAKQVLVWKLSLVGTEFGHWCALFSVLLIVVAIKSEARNSWIGLLAISLAIFVRPAVQAWKNAPTWETQLGTSRPLFSFRHLWFSSNPTVLPREIVYSSNGDTRLSLDLYSAPSSTPLPWLLIVHGGGWDSGDKSQLADINSKLAQDGFAVAAISYRLAPKYKWPTPKEDVLAAVAYLKQHANDLNLDSQRWAIMGRSAGGQIAEAVAFQVKDPTLKALIAYHSPADLQFAYDYSKANDIINSRQLLMNYLGGDPTQLPVAYQDSSPINFVTKDVPPTLLIHGVPDPLTWVEQSRRLNTKMISAGASVTYLELPWATHAFDYSLNGPGGQVSSNATKFFLEKNLKQGSAL